MSAPYVYDQAAFEAFCVELVEAGFSPVQGSKQGVWVGPLPTSLRRLTDAPTMTLKIVDGWPAVAAKISVPGMIADHVTPGTGLICLWAEDDPAQVFGQTWAGLSARLGAWADGAAEGFEVDDRALDAWAYFSGISSRRAEIDLPGMLGTPRNGSIRVVHGQASTLLTFSRLHSTEFPLEGVLLYRSTVLQTPRSLGEVLLSLTRRQRDNLRHGLRRRRAVDEGEVSGGYDFAVLVWPKYGQLEALVLSFAGAWPSIETRTNPASPSDNVSRLRRAGPDAIVLQAKRVLVAGVGAVGGQVAVTLASSGVSELSICDEDDLRSVNLVRHVLSATMVGYSKTVGMKVRLDGSAPWCNVTMLGKLGLDPDAVAGIVRGFDLVVDCTGVFASQLAIARACELEHVPLLSVALHRGGEVFRIRRQTGGATPILQRAAPEYPTIPPGSEEASTGFLEVGCTAPVHNAPPVAVLRAAADTSAMAIDFLTGRDDAFGVDTVTVLRPLDAPPFDRVGTYVFPDANERVLPGGAHD